VVLFHFIRENEKPVHSKTQISGLCNRFLEKRQQSVRKLIQGATRLKPFKGLGHAILGTFSIDQMVTELTQISK